MTSQTFFTPSMKMADLVLSDYSLLTVLSRFDIPLGFGESSVESVCTRYGVDTPLFLLVCNVYAFGNYVPDIEHLSILDIEPLIAYLQRSHEYYRNDKLSSVESRLDDVCHLCRDEHKRILQRFFSEYKTEVINHFEYEEDIAFPYIRNLTSGLVSGEYNIERFEQNHSNIEDKLDDLKNIIIKYLPSTESSSRQCNALLLDLFLFGNDLDKHTLMEERVLIPYVERLEVRTL